ncbi:hypothetical protein [Shimia aestuarii]|uniref:hypothetical protein n=1 Tax=Shimia aestuarii TaxID=254406 RepID=UPI001FB40BEB|nr:hypothetical protein [Shimia aestuarii]
MLKPKTYVGLDNDLNGGMTDTGKIIRDARAFGLIPENETCAGWLPHQIEAIWERANAEWEKYGFRVSAMPENLRTKYMRIQSQAMAQARTAGWTGAQELDDD